MIFSSGTVMATIGACVGVLILHNFEAFERDIPIIFFQVTFIWDILFQYSLKVKDQRMNSLAFFFVIFLKRFHKFFFISLMYYNSYVRDVQVLLNTLVICSMTAVVFCLVPFNVWRSTYTNILPFRLLINVSNHLFIGSELRFNFLTVRSHSSDSLTFGDQELEYAVLAFVLGALAPLLDLVVSVVRRDRFMPFSKIVQSILTWGIGGVLGAYAFKEFNSPTFQAILVENGFVKVIAGNSAEFMRRVQVMFFSIVAGYQTCIPKPQMIINVKTPEEPKKVQSEAQKKKKND